MRKRLVLFLRGLGALVVLGGIVIGLPAGLWAGAGWPLPRAWPNLASLHQTFSARGAIPPGLVVKALAVVGWLAWAELMAALVAEAAAWARGRPARRLRLPFGGGAQALAAQLIASLALLAALSRSPHLVSPPRLPDPVTLVVSASAASPVSGGAARLVDDHTEAKAPSPKSPGIPPAPAVLPAGTRYYVVRPGDTLSGIAAAHLGDWLSYHRIADLNVGRPQPDGKALANDHWIDPGWVLALPAEASGPGVEVVAPAPSPQQVDPPPPAGQARPGDGRSYVVSPGDDAWDIAADQLGDPEAWHALFAANRGRPQPDGGAWTDPGLLRPGWILVLPSPLPTQSPPSRPATSSPQTVHQGPPVHQATNQPPPQPTTSTPPHPDPTPARRALPRRTPPSPPATSPSPTPRASGVVHPAGARVPGGSGRVVHPSEHPSPTTSPAAQHHRPRHEGGLVLGEASVVAASLAAGITAALALARRQRRRSRRPASPVPGISHRESLVTPALARLRWAARMAEDESTQQAPEDQGTPTWLGGDRSGAPAPVAAGLALAEMDGAEVLVDLASGSGLRLGGPGATGVARAAITTLLATRNPETLGVVLAGEGLAGTLLPGVVPFPGLEITDSAEAALDRLEVEVIRRARLLRGAGADTLAAYQEAEVAEPLPALMMVAEAHREAQPRLDAVLSAGGRLGLGAILLFPDPEGASVLVDEHGIARVISPDASLADLDGASFYRLRADEAAELAGVLRASRPDPRTVATSGSTQETKEQAEPFPTPPLALAPAVRICVLGAYRVLAGDVEVDRGLRSKAKEALAYLVVHPDGGSAEVMAEALWPEAPPGRGTERLQTTLSNLRAQLRETSGRPEAPVVIRRVERYRLDPEGIGVDLWDFEAALGSASRAEDEAAEASALEAAAAAYGGDLVADAYYPWAEAAREDLRSRATDALARLATLRQEAGDGPGALSALQQALSLDPYMEELARRAMALQVDLGDRPGAGRTYRRLEAVLADLDVDPEPDTQALAATLVANRRRHKPARAALGAGTSGRSG